MWMKTIDYETKTERTTWYSMNHLSLRLIAVWESSVAVDTITKHSCFLLVDCRGNRILVIERALIYHPMECQLVYTSYSRFMRLIWLLCTSLFPRSFVLSFFKRLLLMWPFLPSWNSYFSQTLTKVSMLIQQLFIFCAFAI